MIVQSYTSHSLKKSEQKGHIFWRSRHDCIHSRPPSNCLTMQSVSYCCPHCFVSIRQRRNLLDHFRSNPGCPYRDPNECFSEASSVGLSSSSPLPPHSPLSPIASSNEYYDDSPPRLPRSRNPFHHYMLLSIRSLTSMKNPSPT